MAGKWPILSQLVAGPNLDLQPSQVISVVFFISNCQKLQWTSVPTVQWL